RWIPNGVDHARVVAAEAILGLTERAHFRRLAAVMRPVVQEQRNQVVRVVALNVREGALNAQLGRHHGDVCGRTGKEARIGYVLDHGHRPEPQSVSWPQRIVVGVDIRFSVPISRAGAVRSRNANSATGRCTAAGEVITVTTGWFRRVLDRAERIPPNA